MVDGSMAKQSGNMKQLGRGVREVEWFATLPPSSTIAEMVSRLGDRSKRRMCNSLILYLISPGLKLLPKSNGEVMRSCGLFATHHSENADPSRIRYAMVCNTVQYCLQRSLNYTTVFRWWLLFIVVSCREGCRMV